MPATRSIKQIFHSQPTLEGAGVHLKRAFGHAEAPLFDPFLLFDDFRSYTPEHFIKGFPWHPHRGIETITYVLDGDVEHGDSLGNSGIISTGDVQWMTAGSGIVHQEMPKGTLKGQILGFQLWANLPAKNKMMPPRYQDIKAVNIPEVNIDGGVTIKIICGTLNGAKGPVQDIVTEPAYLDINIPAGQTYRHTTGRGHTVLVYIIAGSGIFAGPDATKMAEHAHGNETLLLFTDGDDIKVSAGDQGVRFLFMSGKPIGEPIAWQGPIVMNTQAELQTAFEEYRTGTFIKG